MAENDTPAGGTFLNAAQLLVTSHAISAANAPRSSLRELVEQADRAEEERNDQFIGPTYADWRKRPEIGYIVNEALNARTRD